MSDTGRDTRGSSSGVILPGDAGRGASPVRLFGISVLVMALLLVVITLQVGLFWRALTTTLPANLELNLLSHQIRHDMADHSGVEAAGDDPLPRERLLQNGQALDASVARIGELGAGYPPLAAAAEDLREARTVLETLESRALDLAADGRTVEAAAVLNSPEYAAAREAWEAAEEQTLAAIRARAENDRNELQTRTIVILSIVLLGFPVLGGMWLAVWARLRRVEQQRRELEEELRRLSLFDDLTGVYNRRGFLRLAERQQAQANRSEEELLLFFCDLDGMKHINDNLGHRTGDRALRDAAKVLRRTFRKSDVIGRIGGDEFAVLATDSGNHGPDPALDRLTKNLETFNATGDRPYLLSLSVGASHLSGPDQTVDAALAEADAQMYENKRSGHLDTPPASLIRRLST